MAFNADLLTYDAITLAAIKLSGIMRNLKNRLTVSRALVEADDYTRVLANINDIRTFENAVQQVIDAGKAQAVANRIVEIYVGSGVTLADLSAFRTAVTAVRTHLRDNAGAFTLSFDAQDNFQFVTPPGGTVKADLLTLIDNALAIVTV